MTVYLDNFGRIGYRVGDEFFESEERFSTVSM